MLQHTEVSQNENNIPEIKKRAIVASKSWDMATPQGDQAMMRKAESLIRNLKKVQSKEGSFSEYIHCFEKYLNSYVKGCNTKTCGDGRNQIVQDHVKKFVEKAAKSVGISSTTIEDVWSKIV